MRTLNGRFATPEEILKNKLKPYLIMLLFLSFTWGMSVSPRVYQVLAREGANNAKLDETNTTPSPTPTQSPTPTPIWVPATTQKEDIINEITRVFGEDAPTAFNVLWCENRSLNPSAINHNSNGSTDHSIFQINSIHAKRFGNKFMTDWKENIRVARVLQKEQGWRIWSCSHRVDVTPFYK